MRLLTMESLALWMGVALTSGCDDATGMMVDVGELDLSSPIEGGIELEYDWLDFEVPIEAAPTAALLERPDGGGALLRFRVFERPGAPNGGLLRDMAFERRDVGADTSVLVLHTPEVLCQAADCPTPIRAETKDPIVLRDEGLLVAARLHSWGEPFEARHRLLRFTADGALLWSAPIEVGLAEPGVVAELPDGTLVLAVSEGTGFSSPGVRIEVRSADGVVLNETPLSSPDLDDSGAGLPATATPVVTRVVPSRDGGFFVVGTLALYRGIMCGSQDDPMAPDGVVCGQGIGHGLIASYDSAGTERWRTALSADFETPGSALEDVLELDDGSLIATGHIEKRTNEWLRPDHGALVVRLSETGVVRDATRVCPCVDFDAGGALAAITNLRQAPDGAVDAVYRHPTYDPVRSAIRLDLDDQPLALVPMPSSRFPIMSTATGWGYWTDDGRVNQARFGSP